jgi:phosphoglycerate dehydrogenase-like enzyme
VGRGTTVDEEALIAALRSGHLAGAALDVTAVEPLPAESALWHMAQVIITPHSSPSSAANTDRRLAIFCENLRRYQAGEPLINLVDRQAGY